MINKLDNINLSPTHVWLRLRNFATKKAIKDIMPVTCKYSNLWHLINLFLLPSSSATVCQRSKGIQFSKVVEEELKFIIMISFDRTQSLGEEVQVAILCKEFKCFSLLIKWRYSSTFLADKELTWQHFIPCNIQWKPAALAVSGRSVFLTYVCLIFGNSLLSV